MVNAQNTLIFLITIVAIIITLIIPVPIPEEYRLVILATLILLFIGITLSSFGQRLDSQEEKLKIHEQLIEIKSDIKYLKEVYQSDKRK